MAPVSCAALRKSVFIGEAGLWEVMLKATRRPRKAGFRHRIISRRLRTCRLMKQFDTLLLLVLREDDRETKSKLCFRFRIGSRVAVPVVTRALILINAGVFFFELGLSQHALDQVFYLVGMDARPSDHLRPGARVRAACAKRDARKRAAPDATLPAAHPPTAVRRVFAGS